MNPSRRNLLIGKGERLFQDGEWPGTRGGKPDPYNINAQRSILTPVLNELSETARSRDRKLAPRGEVAAKITIHPEFLAKSYFPETLLRNSGLRLVGSRGIDVKPREMVHGKAPEVRPSAVLIVAGTEHAFQRTSDLLNSDEASSAVQKSFNRIESIDPFLPKDRKAGLDLAHFNGWAEIVLHAGLDDRDIREAFFKLLVESGGAFEPDRARSIGGLTFLPVHTLTDSAESFVCGIEEFTHLRTVRNMPMLSVDPFHPDNGVLRDLLLAPPMPDGPAIDEATRALILDGGFTAGLLPWVKASNAAGVPTNVTDLPHGHAVTSAFLFGAIEEDQQTIGVPYCNVEHVRVLPSLAEDTQVVDVIDRILDTLQGARDEGRPFALANLSLGPRLPIVDEDPHEWTVRLDDFLSLGDLFMTVAAGNDGTSGQDLGRIQPPSDAVNAFSVGASDGHHRKARRAPYSCLGPGRSPGLVKPDAVAFGGVKEAPLRLVDPTSGMIKLHAGTSYSAPLAMRLAAGLKAAIDQQIDPTMLHALLVSRAQFNARSGHNQTEVGWGVLPRAMEDILYSPDDEVVVMYQGVIAKGQAIRAAIPLPQGLPVSKSATVAATFSYRAPIDPAHPVNYTRAGLEVLFQPDGESSEGFFSATRFDAEQELRTDALKWETCRHRQRKVGIEKMTNPSFLIRYQGREEGGGDSDAVKDATGNLLPASQQPSALPFALVIRIKVPEESTLSQMVLGQFEVLSEVPLRAKIQI